MKCISLSHGRDGWKGRTREVEKIISSRSRPPFIYDDVLILVPSSRMKRMYGRMFLDALMRLHGATALVQPQVYTLHQLFERLYKRLHGPPVIDEIGRLVLLEGIVKDRLLAVSAFQQNPDLLAPSLSAALATMIDQLAAAGARPEDLIADIKDTDFYHKPQVALLTDVYTRYEAALHNKSLTDPAGMRSSLFSQFDSSWFDGYREIVIDNVQEAGIVELTILRKITALNNCTYLLETPSLDLLTRATLPHPLGMTKKFISALGVKPSQEEIAADSDDLFLATALFSDLSFSDVAKRAPAPSAFTKKINVLSTVNTREEVTLIAAMVKESLQAGIPADAILVAFPALDGYGPLIEEIFADYGIPYNRALGRQLSASPVTTSLVSLLSACQDDFSGPSLHRILNSQFLKFAEQPILGPVLDRFMRKHRIIGGENRLASALNFNSRGEVGPELLAGPLSDLFAALKPFLTQETVPLSAWMGRIDDLIAWSGLAVRVDAVHGPLNINLQAYQKLIEILACLSEAGRMFPEQVYSFDEWFFLMKKTFMHARFQVPPEDEAGVQILGLQESMGRPWKEIYLGGLTEGKFPQHLPQNIFLPESTLAKFGVLTADRERVRASHHFYRLLLSAERITLTHPENEGDRPVIPSPFLKELAPLHRAGLLNRGVAEPSGIQFSLMIEESHSIQELAKAAGIRSYEDIDQGIQPQTTWLTVLSEKSPRLASAMNAFKSAFEQQTTERSTGALPQHKRSFRVTELDDYLNCPYDYYVRHILRLEPMEDVTEDISPLERGSKVHAILRNFYLSWDTPLLRENRPEAETLLKKLADSAFDREADTIRNRREKELFLKVMAGRFLDAEEDFWKYDMRPEYLEQSTEFFKLVLSAGDEVELSAKIDRIDVDKNGNFIIVDYKTGKYPQPKMNIEQEIFQLPVYAVMSRSMLPGKGAPLKKPVGLAYYDLVGKTASRARDVVLYNKDAVTEQPASKPKASPKSAEEFESILSQSIDKARKAVEGIRSGNFAAQPRDVNKCRYCPNKMMCDDPMS